MRTAKELIALLADYKAHVKGYENILTNAPYIIEVGAYTIGIDYEYKTMLEIVDFPVEFTESSKEKIVANCKFYSEVNGIKKPVEIKVWDKIEWYKGKIATLEFMVEHYSKITGVAL